MNKEKLSKIIVLAVVAALAGCSNIPAQPATDGGILSSSELESMIQVTVTKLPPAEKEEHIVAAIDY